MNSENQRNERMQPIAAHSNLDLRRNVSDRRRNLQIVINSIRIRNEDQLSHNNDENKENFAYRANI